MSEQLLQKSADGGSRTADQNGCPPPAVRGPLPSLLRAWWFLVFLSLQRQARARQMVWIALILLGVTTTVVALNTSAGRWTKEHWRMPRRYGPSYQTWLDASAAETKVLTARSPAAAALNDAVFASTRVALERSGVHIFSTWVVFSVFLSFLLPIWSLSFATAALGSEREARSLLWVLTRPLPRASVYLAYFTALLPWSLCLNLGGFALICLAAGWPGRVAFRLYWPAVLWGTLAFCALFHFLAACFRKAAILGMVYVFFLEIILGNMPGMLKRVSISFYTRCLMFDAGSAYGMHPEKPSIYAPVSGPTACAVLLGLTAFLLGLGMMVFARMEYAAEDG
jgi:ABC-type transport system involved in multi-copper enzyme maturation permease subunit